MRLLIAAFLCTAIGLTGLANNGGYKANVVRNALDVVHRINIEVLSIVHRGDAYLLRQDGARGGS